MRVIVLSLFIISTFISCASNDIAKNGGNNINPASDHRGQTQIGNNFKRLNNNRI